MNSAAVIAKSIARSVDREIDGSVTTTEKSPPAPPGLKAVCTIVTADADEDRLLDVVEFDYRDRLKAIGARDGREAAPRGPVYAAAIALRATGMLIRAFRQPYKCKRARIQLLAGLLSSCLLIGWATYLLAAAITTLVSSTTGHELGGLIGSILVPNSAAVLVPGLVTGACFIAFRDGIIRTSNRIAQLIDYHTRPDCAKDLADSLGSAVDAIRDQHLDREIHLLAYSFGSVVLIDTIIPFDGAEPIGKGGFAGSITSMTTVGCPIDFIQLYIPEYFSGRRPLRPFSARPGQGDPITWNNVFIASDLLGSNFAVSGQVECKARQPSDQDEPVKSRRRERDHGHGDELSGDFRGPAGLPVRSFRYLPQERLTRLGWVRQTALRQHSRYWGINGGCWNFVLEQWIPRVGQSFGDVDNLVAPPSLGARRSRRLTLDA